ncbi:hypothetical protein D3C78_1731940 [compost metagenome]
MAHKQTYTALVAVTNCFFCFLRSECERLLTDHMRTMVSRNPYQFYMQIGRHSNTDHLWLYLLEHFLYRCKIANAH